jgi:uncharacterized phage protein (TIGR02218 family)
MSFTAYEQSDYDGMPVELYRFSMGANLWLYTSADRVIPKLTEEYQPVYITRSRLTNTGDYRKATVDITVGGDNPLALIYRSGWLSGTVMLTVFRHHYGDVDFTVIWKGRVINCKWQGSTAELTSESASTMLSQASLRRHYQVGCPHALYGSACGINEASYKVSGTLSVVTATLLTVPGISAYGNGYFTGGMLQCNNELRMIVAHSGDTVTIVDSIASAIVGNTVYLWPGCARTMDSCLNKFNNLDNYGGLPFLPSKNPFSGDALV